MAGGSAYSRVIDFKSIMEAIDLQKLRLIITLAETQSLSLAAQQLMVEPSTLSQQLSSLQYHLGVTLFESHNHALIPTAAGLRLAEEGKRVLVALNRVNKLAQAMKHGEQQEGSSMDGRGTLGSTWL